MSLCVFVIDLYSTEYHFEDLEEGELGGAYSTYREEGRRTKQAFSAEEIENFKDLGVDSKIILKWMLNGMGLAGPD